MRVGAHHAGPYEWVHVIHPDGLNSFDMGVWHEDDGSAFLVRSVNNEYLGISQLAPDYSTTTGLVSTAPRVSYYTVTHLKHPFYHLALHCHAHGKHTDHLRRLTLKKANLKYSRAPHTCTTFGGRCFPS
jgi:hypothetical protein